MSCILVTTDLSPNARTAYPHALRLARAYRLPIRLLHVVDKVYQFNAASHGDSDTYLEQLTDMRRAELLEEAKRFEAEGVVVKTSARLGRAIPEIVAQSGRARVLVMASHGYGGFRRFMLGSVASRVMQQSDAPVLIVNCDDPDQKSSATSVNYDRILIGTDLSEKASGALERTARLLAPVCLNRDPAVELFHADVEPNRITQGREERFDVPGATPDEYKAVVDERLATMKSRLAEDGLNVTTKTLQARRAADALHARAEALDVELLVVSSHGRGRLSVAWLGSTCDEVIRLTHRPVLIIRPRSEPMEG
ncbi:MAG: nucleotide-binding universal stress UspA family protein [Myxococcota bacterium]|jgi:nucleotide-binding universal stress UspA family protein